MHAGIGSVTSFVVSPLPEPAETSWISDNVIVCKLPHHPDFARRSLRDLNLDVLLSVHDRLSNIVRAVTFIESWEGSISPESVNVLTYPTNFTLKGDGFQAPFRSYRTIFSGHDHLSVSGPPIFHNRTQLTFEFPDWLSSASQTRITLQRMGNEALLSWPDTVIHHPGAPVISYFQEAWEHILPSSALTEGAQVVTITGSGFEVKPDASYFCVFQENTTLINSSLASNPDSPQPNLMIRARVLSHRHATCNVSGWAFRAGEVSIWFLHDTAPVDRTVSGYIANSSSLPFVFTQGWSSLTPTQSTIQDNLPVYITGFGFDVHGTYVCVFSKMIDMNSSSSSTISIFDKQIGHNVSAMPISVTALSCRVNKSLGMSTFPVALVTLLQLKAEKTHGWVCGNRSCEKDGR